MHTRLAALVALLLVACPQREEKKTFDEEFFSEEEWAVIAQHSPLPDVPADPTNHVADDPAAAELGQSFFFDKRFQVLPLRIGSDAVDPNIMNEMPVPDAPGKLGETQKVSCATCHMGPWLSDPRQTSLAITWGPKNAPPIVNAVFYDFFGWFGNFDTIWGVAGLYPEPVNFMGGTRVGVARHIAAKYRASYEAVFGPLPDEVLGRIPDHARPKRGNEATTGASAIVGTWVANWTAMSADDRHQINIVFTNMLKAVGAYQRLLVSRNAPWDRYVGGDFAAINSAAKRGAKLFVGKAACSACHAGPFFTDQKFHNTNIPPSPRGSTTETNHFGTQQTFADAAPVIRNPEMEKGQITSWNWAGAGAYSDDRAFGLAKLQTAGLIGASPDLAAIVPDMAEKGKNRTKGLRQIAETGPYMHNGGILTLEAVVEFYNVATQSATIDPLMKPLNLDAGEQQDLVEFMKTLTGEPVAAELLVDTSAP